MNYIKTIICSILLLGLTSFSPSPDAGISFHHGKYAEARKMAKETGKTIFIDGYTTWCGPCKKMAVNVFTDAEVGRYFNQNFVNVKMDMEQTSGQLISRRYNVNFYPTLLFIKPDGSLVGKAVGYHNKSELLALARSVK